MPLSLTTVTDGTVINWTTLRGLILDIETYVNEGIPVGDLATTPWVRSIQVFKPDIYTGTAPRVQLTSGEIHHRYRTNTERDRSVHHPEINTPGDSPGTHGGYLPVEGLSVTYSTPEIISDGSDEEHRVLVRATWFVHECGGDGTVDEATDHVADFGLFVGGTVVPATATHIYTASDGSTLNGTVQPLACKQFTVSYPAQVTTAGLHDLGVRVRMYSKTSSGAPPTDDWRHLIVWGRTLVTSWRVV